MRDLRRRLMLRLVLAQVADVVTFGAFILLVGTTSAHSEQNPLIAVAYGLGGVAGVALLKLGITAIVALRRPREVSVRYARTYTVAASVATASGIAGAGFNIASLVNSL
jgi:hypothetical protein